MTHPRSLAAFTSIVVLIACAPRASESTPAAFTSQDSMAVVASVEKWRTNAVSRDFAAWGTSVTPDVVMYPPNEKPVIGREAAVAYVTAYPTIEKFDIVVDEMIGRGDVAIDRGTYALVVKLPDGSRMNDTGSFLSTFRRQPDATWAHSRVMWHSNAPPPAPATPAPPARRTR